MFDAIQGIPFAFVLCGIIWATVLGFAVGNYACSLVHRLPRGKLILDKTPYCGNCGTLLQVKDLFPVFSALLLRHRCRYCKQPFPVSHTWTEILVGLLFVFVFFQHGFGQHYILIVTVGVFLITLAAIEANENMIMGKILICIVVAGALLRTLVDASIFPMFYGALYGVLIGAVAWRKQVTKVGHIYVLPKQAQLLAVGGLCVGEAMFIQFMLLFAFFWLLDKGLTILLRRTKNIPITVAFGFAVILPLMYPKLFSILS
jgi:prepilin signal peptidase PulO-like enzyme (type II secretory pathway)